VRIARERRAPHPSPTATADAGLPPGGDASPGCAGPPHPHGATRSRQHAQAARRPGRSRATRVAAPPVVAATARRARCHDRTGSSRGQGPPGSRRQLGPAAAATVLDDASTRLGPHPGTEPVLAAATAVVWLEGALHDGAPGSGRWHAAWPGARSPTSVRPVKQERDDATDDRNGEPVRRGRRRVPVRAFRGQPPVRRAHGAPFPPPAHGSTLACPDPGGVRSAAVDRGRFPSHRNSRW
jgi:hypothetical protein